MITYTCKVCGVEWQTVGLGGEVCVRCSQSEGHSRHPLADAPPLPTSEIEAIKVIMLATGWAPGGET